MPDPVATPTQTPPAEPTLYAGKYKTVDELANAYKALETKLGSSNSNSVQPPVAGTGVPGGTPQPPAVEAVKPLAGNFAIDKYEAEFQQHGKLSDESYASLETSGFPRAVVDQYIAGQAAHAAQQQAHAEKTVYDAAGGEKAYQEMILWAAQNLQKGEVDGFNNILNTANPAAISLAVSGLRAKYDTAFGREPERRVGGGQIPTGPKPFRSDAEVVEAMKDPRYAKDPAYRADVESRLKAS